MLKRKHDDEFNPIKQNRSSKKKRKSEIKTKQPISKVSSHIPVFDTNKSELFLISTPENAFTEYHHDYTILPPIDFLLDNKILGSQVDWYSSLKPHEENNLSDNEFSNFIPYLEMLSCYACKSKKIDTPIFNFFSYTTVPISFHVFFIKNHDDPKKSYGLLFFDNYETDNFGEYQLRFTWWNLGYQAGGQFKEALHNAYLIIKRTITLSSSSEIPNDKIFVLPFKKPPHMGEIKQIQPSSNDVSLVKLPVLNPDNWGHLTVVLNHNGTPVFNNFKCLLASNTQINFIQSSLAELYASFLQKELGRSAFIFLKNWIPNFDHDIYFILSNDLKLCIGLFIFQLDYRTLSEQSTYNNPSSNDSINFFSKIPSDKKIPERKIPHLTTAWMHPFHRRQGLSSKLFNVFRLKYTIFQTGDLNLEAHKFLEKNNANFVKQPNFTYLIG